MTTVADQSRKILIDEQRLPREACKKEKSDKLSGQPGSQPYSADSNIVTHPNSLVSLSLR